MDLTSTYAGLTLKNPLVAASSGITASLPKIELLARSGVGAIVLKSLFEEQIEQEALATNASSDNFEGAEYMAQYLKGHRIQNHLDLIAQAKKVAQGVPVIASLNCYKGGEWIRFAKQMEQAGADAVELNIMRLETSPEAGEQEVVDSYVEVCTSVAKELTIPVAVKLDKQFTCLPALVERLRKNHVKGVTCFNRSFRIDIDTENLRIKSGTVLTGSDELSDTLKFTAILSGRVPDMVVSSSGGVQDAQDVIKCLLAGAGSVQLASALYKNGPEYVAKLLADLQSWMERKQYQAVNEFRGKLVHPADGEENRFERVQFMKYFSSYEG